MFGFSSAMAPPDPQAAPQPQAQPPQAAPAQPYQPSWWDVLQGVVFNGQSPADAAMAARSRQYQIQQSQLLMGALQNAAPDERKAMLFNPGEYGKAEASHYQNTLMKGGDTLVNGPTPGPYTSPTYGLDDKSGRGYSIGPAGLKSYGPSLGGDISAKDGLVSSGRTGPTGQTYSQPQIVPAGSTGVGVTPVLSGGLGQPQAPAPSMGAPPQGGPAPANTPRGLRNNNPTNVKALPHGQLWNGQTGVDDQGHAVFGTMEDGLRAARTNLQSYATNHGINTVSGVVSRWAPPGLDGSHTGEYAKYVAANMGVTPNQPLDMSDPKVQRGLVENIVNFENGAQAAKSWRPAAASGQGQGSGFGQPFAQGGRPQVVPETDPIQQRLPPGAVAQKSAAGEYSVMPGTGYGPDQLFSLRKQVLDSDAYKNYQAANDAYGAMVSAAGQPNGGMRAYALRDTFARLINPGAVARVGTIQAISEAQGVPANVKAYLMNLKGDGNVPSEIAQQILDVSHGFLGSHYAAAKSLNDSNTGFATRHKIDPQDVTAPMGEAPNRMVLGQVPPAQQRQPGTIYVTPKGPLLWTTKGKATGWAKTN